MTTLVMVESWLHSTGRALPGVIRGLGHDYVLLTKDPSLYAEADAEPGASRVHPVIALADEVVVTDTDDPDTLAAAARDVATRYRIGGAVTTCDYYLVATATVAEELGLVGASPEVMRRATRKHLVRAALDEASIPQARSAVVDDWEQALAAARSIGYPLIAKPVDLNAGTSVELIEDDAALKDAFWAIRSATVNTRGQRLCRLVLLEELLCGVEVSVEAVTVDGRTNVLGITDKSVTAAPARVESSHMFPADLGDAARDVEAYVRRVLEAVGFQHGLSHTEVMITSGGPRLVEFNPRQGGGHIFDLVHRVTGVHPLRTLVEIAVGAQPAEPSPEVRPRSAAVAFIMAPRAGTVVAVDGLDSVTAERGIDAWCDPLPAPVRRPTVNEYLGRIMVTDAAPGAARRRAEYAVERLRLRFDDGEVVAPLALHE